MTLSPHVRESEKFLLVDAGILGFDIPSTAEGVRIPLATGSRTTESGLQYLESGNHGVESRIQTVLDSLTRSELWEAGKTMTPVLKSSHSYSLTQYKVLKTEKLL